MANCEKNFKGRIVLLKKCTQIGFKVQIESGKRLEDTDRRCGLQRRRMHTEIPNGGHGLPECINDGTTQGQQKDKRRDFAGLNREDNSGERASCAWEHGSDRELL